jgi:hypothetical protein
MPLLACAAVPDDGRDDKANHIFWPRGLFMLRPLFAVFPLTSRSHFVDGVGTRFAHTATFEQRTRVELSLRPPVRGILPRRLLLGPARGITAVEANDTGRAADLCRF